MNSRRIVLIGGCALAFGAAFANMGLVLQTGTSVSHLTGDVGRLTLDITNWSPAIFVDLCQVATAAFSFLLGATLAGAFIHHPTLDLSRPYGRSITGIGILFLLSAHVVVKQPLAGIGLTALGCGFQNALASHFRGIILRTTHLTGMFTDLGITLGMRLRGHDIPNWKIATPAGLILSFFLGGLTAGLLHHTGLNLISTAGAGYCAAGIGWTIKKHGLFRKKSF